MIRLSYTLELITPCFCGGAEPDQHAEIRPASIRGQLRWWFRVLGGFKSLAAAGMNVRDQEDTIFGSAAGDDGNAGKLILRVFPIDLKKSQKDSEQLGHRPFTPPAFLTFPLQSRPNQSGIRGVIEGGSFDLVLLWRGNPELAESIRALLSVFANFGSLGFRSRRAMGALAVLKAGLRVSDWQKHFVRPDAIAIRSLPATSSSDAISRLGAWLKGCRSHGRTGQNTTEQQSPYFKYAENDHDIGYAIPGTASLPAFRPAIGLPIIQRTRNGTNQWEFGRGNIQESKGRFASPVILRPHRVADGTWRALVIFVDAMQWPAGKPVFLNGQPRAVSLDLYNAMKADPRLTPFP